MNDLSFELQQAKILIDKGKLQEALEQLETLLKKYQNQETIVFELGKVHMIKQEYDKAIYFLSNIKIDKDLYKLSLYMRFNIYKILRNFDKLIEVFKDINLCCDIEKNIVVDLIHAYIEQKQYELALSNIKKYEQLLKTDVHDIKLYAIKKYIEEEIELNEYSKVFNIIDRYKTILKKDLVEINKLAIDKIYVYIKQLNSKKEYEKAIQVATSLSKRDILSDKIQFELGNMYFVKKDYKKAEEVFLNLQNTEVFFVISTEMLQKIYKILGVYNKSLIQFYKIYKHDNINKDNVLSALDSSLAQKKYRTYLRLLMIAKNNNTLDNEFISNKLIKIYEEIIKSISKHNTEFNYKESKKIYRTVIKFIPKEEKKVRNILLNEYEIATGCYNLKSKPRILTLELTNKCNLKCIMCEYKKKKHRWEITDNVYNELLSVIPYLEHLILQGGEVFLYKNIKNILKSAIREDVSVEIVTNGLLLSEEILNILIHGKNIITFSIDSINKNVYETIRVNGKFEKLIESLNKLIEVKKSQANNLLLRLHMVIMKKNYEEIEDIIKFAAKYEFNEVYLEPVANEYIGKEESIFELGYNESIVSVLENKRSIFDELAKKNNIKLINHLPTVKYCQSLVKAKIYNNNNNILKRKSINKYLWLFKIRKPNDMNFNYAVDIYKKLNFKNICLKNQKLFCYAPWHKLSIYNRNISVPTCFCPIFVNKIMLNPLLEKIKNKILKFLSKKKFIISEWNSRTMLYYRKAIILQKEKEICAKDCLDNRILLKERGVRYN